MFSGEALGVGVGASEASRRSGNEIALGVGEKKDRGDAYSDLNSAFERRYSQLSVLATL